MSLNISNPELFYAVNTALNLTLFTIFSLPTLILCVLCIVALLFAKEINWKIRVIMINLLTPEAIVSLSYIMSYVGYPVRAYSSSDNSLTCTIFSGVFVSGAVNRVTAAPFFAVAVFIFVKCNVVKLKWWVIVLSLVVFSLLALSAGVFQFFTNREVARNGFCIFELSFDGSEVVITIFVMVTFGSVLLSLITVVVGVLSYCSVKKTVSHDVSSSTTVKKAVTKILSFHAFKVVFQLLTSGVTSLYFIDQESHSVLSTLLIYYALEVLYWPFIILTPIASLILLKPIRTALRQMCLYCSPRTRQTTSGE